MRTSPNEPERRCILSGAHGTRDGLIRLALGPYGEIAPDLNARAGGRGAWIGVPRSELEKAQKKGRLRGALNRAFRTADVQVPDDLGERIESGLAKAALDRLGLENRAGALILGGERIAEALQGGRARLLLHAEDAGADGLQGLGGRAKALGITAITCPAGREALSLALGRANVVHIAVAGPGPAARILAAVTRWRDFTGKHISGREETIAGAPASSAPGTQG